MTKATKRKLAELTSEVNLLTQSTSAKDQTIKYLFIGIGIVAVIVVYFVFIRKRRGK